LEAITKAPRAQRESPILSRKPPQRAQDRSRGATANPLIEYRVAPFV